MAFDASPSWSGFNYQGKVALYHTLKLINAKPVDTDLSSFSLMLESIEDFEIIIDKSPISFHQVKAYNENSYSSYSDALLGITLELYKYPNAYGKIHTWKLINSKPGFSDLKTSIEDDLKFILNEYKNSTDGKSILEKATSGESKIPKTSAIIRAAFKGEPVTTLTQLLESILMGENDALSRLDAYQYDDGDKFCDLNKINDKIKSEISTALSARKIPVTSDHLDKVFHHFLGMIDRYIIQRHKTKQKDEKISIKFNEIIEVVQTDHEDIGKEYLAYKFKERFAYHLDHFMEDPEEEYKQPETESYCNLQESRKLLMGLNPLELWEHYRHFSPQICLQHNNNIDNAFETNPEGIRYMLIRIFHDIDFKLAAHNQSKYKLTYRETSPPYQHYLPTTITNTARITQIERQITSNPSINEILYEIENLIYNGTDSRTFSPSSTMHTEAPIAEDADLRPKRDEVLKFINLVPLSIAKVKLT